MITYLFPGQGSQHVGMGASLFDEFSELTAQADEILGYSIKALCLEDANKQLNQTQFTQPALYFVNALSYRQAMQNAENPPADFLMGHSLGEFNALEAAGVFSLTDGLRLVQKRGELMSQAPKGAMAAIIGISSDEIAKILADHQLQSIDIANYNGPTQTIISGLEQDIQNSQSIFEDAQAMFIPLNTSGAFHSRYMQEAQQDFSHFLSEFQFSRLKTPVISNVTAQPYLADQVANNLTHQISHSVQWVQSMCYLLSLHDMDFKEIGPGQVLTKLTGPIKKAVKTGSLQFEMPIVETKTESSSARPEGDALTSDEKEKSKANDAITQASAQETALSYETESNQTRSNENKSSETGNNHAEKIDSLNLDGVTPLNLDQRIEKWNQQFPVGTKVTVKNYDGVLETKTQAMVLFGHRAAIYMQGYNGYFALDEVTPV